MNLNYISNLISSPLNSLAGYASNAIASPQDVNGENSININDVEMFRKTTQSTLFTSSIANLNLVAALRYDENMDPFNPGEGSIYNITANLDSGTMDNLGNLGQAFR